MLSSYKACEDCFKWNDSVIYNDELKANDNNDNDNDDGSQSFVYKKFKFTLARLSYHHILPSLHCFNTHFTPKLYR